MASFGQDDAFTYRGDGEEEQERRERDGDLMASQPARLAPPRQWTQGGGQQTQPDGQHQQPVHIRFDTTDPTLMARSPLRGRRSR